MKHLVLSCWFWGKMKIYFGAPKRLGPALVALEKENQYLFGKHNLKVF